jgi:anti-sigma-K factor RskA
MTRRIDPRRDRELADLLRSAAVSDPTTDVQLRALGERIRVAAAPLLAQREQRSRSVWDYAEYWSGTLIRVGVATAVAASVCLFWLSSNRSSTAPVPAERVALIGAATNRVSSHDLLDLLTAESPAPPLHRR